MLISNNGYAMLLACSLLTKEKLVLQGVPRVPTVDNMCKLLGELGCNIIRRDQDYNDPGDLELQVVSEKISHVRAELIEQFPYALYVIGPLLASRGECIVSIRSTLPAEFMSVLADSHAFGYTWKTSPEGDVTITRANPVGSSQVVYAGLSPSAFWTYTMVCLATASAGNSTIEEISREPEFGAAFALMLTMQAILYIVDKQEHPNMIKGRGGEKLHTIPIHIFNDLLKD